MERRRGSFQFLAAQAGTGLRFFRGGDQATHEPQNGKTRLSNMGHPEGSSREVHQGQHGYQASQDSGTLSEHHG